ncbi:MAG: SDR family oxidoreductase [Hyphomonadaceae bacterium]
MRVLVLGAYGLIGLAVSRRLMADGHKIVGLARSAKRGTAFLPAADWLEADISKLTRSEDWHHYLDSIDVVVNASGALQTGLKDNVANVQTEAIRALIKACENSPTHTFVQISAPGATETADTEFYRTKGMADAALRDSTLNWTILRPGLVISPHAYGGTSLIRTLAAFPIVQPILLANAPIQTVSIDDVTKAVSMAVNGDLPKADIDLVEPQSQTLADLVASVRSWLGFSKAKATLEMPNWSGRLTAKLADLAGWLGWRSPMRSTALTVLTEGVTGDPEPWERLSDHPARSLKQTLDHLPSTAQERIFARAMLAYPFLLIILSGFWIVSGTIGLAQQTSALKVVEGTLPSSIGLAFVRIGSIADILIGISLVFRPTTRLACLASIAVSISYLIGSVLFAPELWTDPLGPMVKVFPAIALSVIVAALTQDR